MLTANCLLIQELTNDIHQNVDLALYQSLGLDEPICRC